MSDGHFRPAPEVVARRLGDAVVLVRLATHTIFELNVTGARLWEMLGEGMLLTDALVVLRDEFEGTDAQIASDAAALVAALVKEHLLEPA